MKTIHVAVIGYPGGMRSAIEGLSELFGMANRLALARAEGVHFEVQVLSGAELTGSSVSVGSDAPQVVILPPCIEGRFYTDEQPVLSGWLKAMHGSGALLCSVCAGAFLLAQTGLLNQRAATTHWMLADQLAQRFPGVRVDDSRILINDGDLMTAGGLMAWLDLGLELVAQFGSPALMRQLGKQLVVDTAPRQQRYYRCFIPPFDHGDRAVLKSQHYLQSHTQTSVTVKQLAEECHLTERTFLRRFVRATGYKPKEYIQQLRISKACDALESSADSIEVIALSSGYDDVSAFRKVFIKITGLTPREFRRRFSAQT
ncbi:GlxA family transcriptional regulator [Amphritea pacifica]|uniref:Helix-turn-helix domain-containing protein n=1 Tax=Amphritea pacifica TaxID=2811233 RepID=A0ABS2WAV5_9GAMM|nr:helix-turn-helix domain-containing protein [Amphritea pacifica]MBN0988848.1 helix-turn-helix domain-containing protein [Amphritea pacifica]MBN1006310.1 helix-turn-helix domain-containing protein [Amphritea pacifica]